jgi:hypothetical protein
MGARKYWVDWFPAQEQIIEGATMEYPLVIDVGGGRRVCRATRPLR